jgi:hypothetical protein
MGGIGRYALPLAGLLCLCACNDSLTAALQDKVIGGEKEAPIPGGGGALAVGIPRATVLPLSWSAASDNLSAAAELQYKVVFSRKDDIGTAADAEANGTTALDWTAAACSCDVEGLSILTTYHVNVLVRDRAGNTAAYGGASGATTDDTESPIAGNSGALQADNAAMDVFTVTWTKAVDDISPQTTLQYQAFYSKNDDISTLAAIQSNGTAFGTPAVNISRADITVLDDNVRYYVNVVVQDEKGNKAAYQAVSGVMRKHPRIYMTYCPSPGNISRADSFSPYARTTIIPGNVSTDGPAAIAVDPVERKIYWTDYTGTTARIRRADFDGGNAQDLVTSNLTTPDGIAVDFSASRRYLYWTDSTKNKIYRSALPPSLGANADSYAILDNASDGVNVPEGIDVDISTGEFYWVEDGSNRIRKAPAATPHSINNLVITGISTPFDIAVDYENHVYYWTDHGLKKIQAHGATGSTYDVINLNLTYPAGISVDMRIDVAGDTDNHQLVWVDLSLGKAYKAPVSPSTTDANDYQIISGLGNPIGIQAY